ncbi:5'-methylthioadenosine/adenosylhomocysteine nucleosidase [Mammaliicoccus sciuri]|jgi:adenosylhomocysteine nucleosidase|uniref:5'-methylthioadenosine/adenosylhomocysteine nucleosidase n=1 Tax=Mammaliicoccus TaxID=2803850 RepID=UPI000446AC43|nr:MULTISPECIES: 5'-methylthioadenosine/adenosylhomocysteine nucleosidase [Mammaliicoccus]EZX24267.1 MTA/SAH nucleosidase [Staphylococcus aureus C0673]MBN4908618.1 5'-methylthioadenosine/adenosylhomocysteine nucleosidase [Staphylococcus sp. EG-SA-13]OOV37878.1 5'-methylthioadenosine/S-adenosylhomocysteine nucleosidase [Staphylococcus sp. MB371]PCQ21845.1 5'-methylthioadenosine/adenosylhomocysteine nucleosidase [Klebsiella pneumoniae]MBF0719483.1 5'-methylthioadenosine/adenosylhomocysteine nucl
MIGIIGAMEEEVEILKSSIENRETIQIAHVIFYKGNIEDKQVVLAQSGIGKVNAAITATLLINEFKPDLIINTGSAGSVDSELNIGDIIISNKVYYHDVNATAFGYKLGQVPSMPEFYETDKELIDLAKSSIEQLDLNGIVGEVATGDSFIGSIDQRKVIKSNFPTASVVEMEAGAIAQTCYQYNVPIIVTRAVSDLADKESDVTFEEFLKVACVNSSKIVKLLLNRVA